MEIIPWWWHFLWKPSSYWTRQWESCLHWNALTESRAKSECSFKREWCLSENINGFGDKFRKVVCLYNISYRNTTGEVREVSLGRKKLSYKLTLKIVFCALKLKYITNSPPLLHKYKYVPSAGQTAYDLVESPDEAQWEWVQQSHDWKRRNRHTTLKLSHSLHLLLFFFSYWKDLRYFFLKQNHWCVLSSSKNNDASF